MASNPIYHARTKHIEIDFHFVKDKVTAKEVKIEYILSEKQTIDIFIKALSIEKFSYHKSKLKVEEIDLSLRKDVEWTKLLQMDCGIDVSLEQGNVYMTQAQKAHLSQLKEKDITIQPSSINIHRCDPMHDLSRE